MTMPIFVRTGDGELSMTARMHPLALKRGLLPSKSRDTSQRRSESKLPSMRRSLAIAEAVHRTSGLTATERQLEAARYRRGLGTEMYWPIWIVMAVVVCAAFCGLVWWFSLDVMDFSDLGDDLWSDELDEDTKSIDLGNGDSK